jgi:hypothetical protein
MTTEKQPSGGEAGETKSTPKAKPVEATQDTSKPPKAGKTSHGNVRTDENKGEGIGEVHPQDEADDPDRWRQ